MTLAGLGPAVAHEGILRRGSSVPDRRASPVPRPDSAYPDLLLVPTNPYRLPGFLGGRLDIEVIKLGMAVHELHEASDCHVRTSFVPDNLLPEDVHLKLGRRPCHQGELELGKVWPL